MFHTQGNVNRSSSRSSRGILGSVASDIDRLVSFPQRCTRPFPAFPTRLAANTSCEPYLITCGASHEDLSIGGNKATNRPTNTPPRRSGLSTSTVVTHSRHGTSGHAQQLYANIQPGGVLLSHSLLVYVYVSPSVVELLIVQDAVVYVLVHLLSYESPSRILRQQGKRAECVPSHVSFVSVSAENFVTHTRVEEPVHCDSHRSRQRTRILRQTVASAILAAVGDSGNS